MGWQGFVIAWYTSGGGMRVAEAVQRLLQPMLRFPQYKRFHPLSRAYQYLSRARALKKGVLTPRAREVIG